MSLGEQLAMAQQHVNHVVAAQTDVQHDERDGQEIQMTDRGGRERRGERQAHEQSEHGDHEQAPRAQRHVQHEHDHEQCRDAGERGAASDARELLVLHRDAAAEPHGHRRRLGGVQARDDLANPGNRVGSGLHSREVECRLQHDEAARARFGAAREQRIPRQRLGLARARAVERARDGGIERRERGRVRRAAIGPRFERARRDVQHGGAVEARLEQTE